MGSDDGEAERKRRRGKLLSLFLRVKASGLLSWLVCGLILTVLLFYTPGRKTRGTLTRVATSGSHKKKPDRVVWRDDVINANQGGHVYHSDGLLEVDPEARTHPILELMERAEQTWRHKLAKQSKTLKAAAAEYRRRYGRPPPDGFEVWWDYADFHNVQLIDEYDSINARLEPYWGVRPAELRQRQAEFEAHPDTFTIGKEDDGPLRVLADSSKGHSSASKRAQDQIDVLLEVQDWLPPDFRATFTMHDGPAQFVSWEMRQRAIEAAAQEEYLDASTNFKPRMGWEHACPPDSPIHLSQTKDYGANKTFIWDHLSTMDPCLHPSHLRQHGYLSSYHRHKGPGTARALTPTFSICATTLHSDLLTAAPEQFAEATEIGRDPAWEDKVDDRMLWRGSNTGILFEDKNWWNDSQRVRLVETGTRRGGHVNVLWPRVDVGKVGVGDEIDAARLNAAFMDVAFTGKPIQCKGKLCDVLERMFDWRKRQNFEDAWQYKYIMDIDGNGWSARFKRLMTSNSLVFKSTIFPEWYTERIMPWLHYVPIKLDLSDMYGVLAFFRGDLLGRGENEHLAKYIAQNGREWSLNFYRREDMTAYHFRLFLEYARVMRDDRDEMGYVDPPEVDKFHF